MASDFDGIDDAEVGVGGTYLREGIYPDLEILALKKGQSRKKEKFFVAEVKVHKSQGEKANPIGSKASWMVMFKHDAALGNIRGFLAAAGDCEVEEVDTEAAELAVSDEQPFAGTHLQAEALNIETKKGTPFTKVTWAPRA